MKLFNNLPLYEAIIANENCGVYKVSCVSNPATEVNWVAFDENKPYVKFAVDNKIERMISGVIMLAETPIYRRTADGYEYYVMYSKDTLKTMAEKMIFDGVGSNVNIQHQDGTDVEGVNLVELYVINREKGIAPQYFENVPDGSLIGTYKVHNDALWEMIENGDVLSFSLEGIFNLEETFSKQEQNNNNTEKENKFMSKLNRIKQALKSLLIEFGEISTDGGVLIWDTDEELKIGDAVHSIDENGNDIEVADGTYTTEDKKQIIVKDGKVEDIVDVEAEVSSDVPEQENPEGQENSDDNPALDPVEEPAEEPETDEKDKLIEELKEQILVLTEENNQLKEKVAELEKEPAALSASEEFEKKDEGKPMSEADKLRQKGYRF